MAGFPPSMSTSLTARFGRSFAEEKNVAGLNVQSKGGQAPCHSSIRRSRGHPSTGEQTKSYAMAVRYGFPADQPSGDCETKTGGDALSSYKYSRGAFCRESSPSVFPKPPFGKPAKRLPRRARSRHLPDGLNLLAHPITDRELFLQSPRGPWPGRPHPPRADDRPRQFPGERRPMVARRIR